MNHHRNRNSADSCGHMRRVCATLWLSLQKTVMRDWRPGRYGAAAAPVAAFSRPCGVKLCGMVPSMAGRAGVSSDTPVPYPGTPTPHGLPPLIGVGGGRFNTCRYGAIPMADTRTAAPSSYHPHALRAPAFELVTGGAQ